MIVRPSSMWFGGDIDSSVESFFFDRGLSTTREGVNAGFLVIPETQFTFLLCVDNEGGFKFVRKDGMHRETVLDTGEVKAYDRKASECVVITTGIYMEQYHFFCTEITEITENQKQKGNPCTTESGELFTSGHIGQSRS